MHIDIYYISRVFEKYIRIMKNNQFQGGMTLRGKWHSMSPGRGVRVYAGYVACFMGVSSRLRKYVKLYAECASSLRQEMTARHVSRGWHGAVDGCSICLEPRFTCAEIAACQTCKAAFHWSCLWSWLCSRRCATTPHTCPYCRSAFLGSVRTPFLVLRG